MSQFPPWKGTGLSKVLLHIGDLVCCSGANTLGNSLGSSHTLESLVSSSTVGCSCSVAGPSEPYLGKKPDPGRGWGEENYCAWHWVSLSCIYILIHFRSCITLQTHYLKSRESGLLRRLSRFKPLPPSLKMWVWVLGSVWWKERSDSHKLFSDLHLCALTLQKQINECNTKFL